MTARVDLHVHTNASEDGELSAREVIGMAAALGVETIAFADHDSTASVDEGRALAAAAQIDFLEGVELTTLHGQTDVHVLGYLLDPHDPTLCAACEATRVSRVGQARGRIDKMTALGFDIDYDRVMAIAAGRPPTSAILLKALCESYDRSPDPRLAPYITGAKSASGPLNLFLDFFSPGCPCYVPGETLSTRDGVRVILGARGVPVLAHPGRLPVETVDSLLALGFYGVEVWSTNHTPEQEAFYSRMACDRGLVATAGSDFHGPSRRTAPLASLRGGTTAMADALRERRAAIFA